ncbi:Apoptosis-inducing factor [Penicillium canariense]|uniref:Apoptosis-inducing factor n=1 Tax=Penicillium canariense TaxID=189055 RepID=A0A9W9LMY7_9EURO|nr:Apoptosis-inducing factor [Penicillium canariense]KAJ5167349.1 Apoptosis-inducing factor [Penicillium canariense]
MAPINVVIVGAGCAGVSIAHSLLQGVPNTKVVLVNPSQTFYWNIAAPRIVAKPKAFKPEQYLLPIKDAFVQYPADTFEFIAGIATAIDVAAKSVSITPNGSADSKSLPYDHLVIASGSTNPSSTGAVTGISVPFKPSNRDDIKEIVEAAQQQIANAKEIVIGGAGPVGVELAGELAEELGSKATITLISSADRVLPMLKPSGSYAGEKLLKQKNVKIITSAKVTGAAASTDGTKSWTVSLDNGNKVLADLYIPTTGAIPNSSFIPAEFLDADGWVKVNKELRVQASGGSALPIYAVGDINTNTMRLSFKATEQAKIAAANIKADILGKGDHKAYEQGNSVMMAVPIGETGGTGQMFGMTPFSFIVKLAKGRDYFVSKAAQALAGKT